MNQGITNPSPKNGTLRFICHDSYDMNFMIGQQLAILVTDIGGNFT